MELIFSINNIRKKIETSSINEKNFRKIPNNTNNMNNMNKPINTVFRYGMFERLQNTTNCSSCGK